MKIYEIRFNKLVNCEHLENNTYCSQNCRKRHIKVEQNCCLIGCQVQIPLLFICFLDFAAVFKFNYNGLHTSALLILVIQCTQTSVCFRQKRCHFV